MDVVSGLSGAQKVAGGVGIFIAGAYLYLSSLTDDVPGDLFDIVRLIRMKRDLEAVMSSKSWSVVDMFSSAVQRNPNGDAMHFIDTNTTYSFKRMDEITNQVAHWATSVGIRSGDVVALLMDNRPEYVLTWLGLAKVGATIALINTNLSGRPLVHSLSVCNAKKFIIGIEHAQRGSDGKQALGTGEWFCYGGHVEGMTGLDACIAEQPITPPHASLRSGHKPSDTLFYIYTSGTTGNPKASIIKHVRFYTAGMGFSRSFQCSSSDRIYCALPLYHSAGGMIGVGLSWYNAACLVFRRKFSKRHFWSDVRETRSTIIQYIGELCRYLLQSDPHPDDGKHSVRLAIGNGLRPDVWGPFQKRFNIPVIGEFYAATEGNASLINYKNRQGAVGYISPLISRLYPVKVVKFDVLEEEVIRGPDGLCIECAPGETGELVGKIDNSDPTRQFDGYTDKAATERKILRNVFEKGDEWFRSGDLLMRDAKGFFYFKDRIGDTFRWKGENVATSEVGLVLDAVPGVLEANVYGVPVPGHDGKAGMAAITVERDAFSLEQLFQAVSKELPSYARPLFIRIQPQMNITGTFKHQKFELKKVGYDPSKTTDPLFIRDDKLAKYVPLSPDMYNEIMRKAFRSRL
eukprot:TRINITY_DN2654_c0_g1_i1.p1 TRINITY_DN2654_c0_g1~~TRINITY_DN2654_c0_g1_i1.p1  ORF type:complete len:652 (+),score=205.34 TRINITY_DN2654_c0_g1_i1:69-1958(+)